MRKASLFSGIGGIDLAAKWAGMETVVFCERETFPQQVLRKHWPDVPIIDDVHDFTRKELERLGIGAIDIISAGYPCQPFSYAGKRRGAEDDRHLWPEVARILSEVRPRWFVGENVAGHVTLGLDDVLSDLENEGYTAQAFVIPAAAVRASHRRDRVFIVAYAGYEQSSGWNETQKGHEYTHGRKTWSKPTPCNCNVAYAGSPGRQERYASAESNRSGYGSGCCHAESLADAQDGWIVRGHGQFRGHDESGGSGGNYDGRTQTDDSGQRRTTQPGMGRGPDEFPAEMDGGMNPLDALAEFIARYPQPALMGQPQYDWEPPRVATGVKNRAARLKALGNAVDPLQIVPIMYAIKVVDDWLREGTA